MTEQPQVSIRVSIRWPPAAAYEDSDILVLTGPSGTFIDLRIVKDGPRKGNIDWALAGNRILLPDSTTGKDHLINFMFPLYII